MIKQQWKKFGEVSNTRNMETMMLSRKKREEIYVVHREVIVALFIRVYGSSLVMSRFGGTNKVLF